MSAGALFPEFLIIGGQRCGTTSLYQGLVEHPQVAPALRKEVHYFDLHYQKGVEWYLRHFQAKAEDQARSVVPVITGEASPYYLFHPQAPERVFRTLPQIKLIVMLRDPVTRAISQYHHSLRRGYEKLSLEQAFGAEEARLAGEAERLKSDAAYQSAAHRRLGYAARSRYLEQLSQWRAFFPADQFLIIQSEVFFADQQNVYRRVFEFLEISSDVTVESCHRNRGAYDEPPRGFTEQLGQRFAAHNERLADYLSVEFGQTIDLSLW